MMSCPYAFSNLSSSSKKDEDHSNESSPIAASPSNPSSSSSSTLTPIQALQLAKSSCPAFQSSCPFRNVQDARSMKKALENMPSSHYEQSSSKRINNSNGGAMKANTIISEMQKMTMKNSGSSSSNANNNAQEKGEDGNDTDKKSGVNQHIEISQSLRVALQHVHAISESIRSNTTSNEQQFQVNEIFNKTNDSNKDRDHHESSSSTGSNKSLRKYSLPGGICPYKTLNPRFTPVKTKHGNNSNNNNNNQEASLKFVNAMEEFSFSAILAKLVHHNSDEEENGNDGKKTLSSFDALTVNETSSAPSDPTISASTEHTVPLAAAISSTTNINNNTTVVSTLKKSKSNTSLSTALKVGTAKSHSSAESVHFVKEFIKGNIDRTLYSILIANLYWVYSALEEELEVHAPVEFPTLHRRELYRRKSLEDDLEFFYTGLDFDENCIDSSSNNNDVVRMKIPPSQATKDYIHRLKFIAKEEPLLLLSHAYTRYLGDLSGGKVLARVAKRALNLKGESNGNSNNSRVVDGLSFYHFDKIQSAKKFKDEYRHALDNLDYLSEEQIERLVAEANVAFVLNMRIFEELDVLGGVKGSTVRDYSEATFYYEECIEEQEKRRVRGLVSDMNYYHTDETNNQDEDMEKFECPFAKLGGPNPHKHHGKTVDIQGKKESEQDEKIDFQTLVKPKRCPWPFIFMHDPQTGLRDWQTWFTCGLLLCLLRNLYTS